MSRFDKTMIAGCSVALAACLLIRETGGFDWGDISLTNYRNPLRFLFGFLIIWTVKYIPQAFSFLIPSKNHLWIALGLLMLAVAPRVIDLAGGSLNIDELQWIGRGRHLKHALEEGEWVRATHNLMHPGVTPAALVGWGLGDVSIETYSDEVIWRARILVALLGAMTIPLLFLLASRFTKPSVAFIAAAFLALDPIHIGLSRLAHVDAILTCFCMVTVLSYALGEKYDRWPFFVLAGLSWGAALLTKAPAFGIPAFLVLWKTLVWLHAGRSSRLFRMRDVWTIMLGFTVYVSLYSRLWLEVHLNDWKTGISHFTLLSKLHEVVLFLQGNILAEVLVLLCFMGWVLLVWRFKSAARHWGLCVIQLLALGSFVLLALKLWPNLFENTLVQLRRLFHLGSSGEYEAVLRPDNPDQRSRFYYLYLLLVRLPIPLLIFSLIGLVVGLVKRRSAALWLTVSISLGFVVMMSGSDKMALRYILPIYPFICLLASWGFWHLIDHRQNLKWPMTGALSVYFLCLLGWYHPNYYLYHNRICGGPTIASKNLPVGWGAGQKEGVALLRAHVSKRPIHVVAKAYTDVIIAYWGRDEKVADLIINQKEEAYQFLLITSNHRYRHFTQEELDELEPMLVDVAKHRNIEIAWLYKLD